MDSQTGSNILNDVVGQALAKLPSAQSEPMLYGSNDAAISAGAGYNVQAPQPGVIQSALNFAGGLAHSVGNIASGVGGFIADHTFAPIVKDIGTNFGLQGRLNDIQNQRQLLDQKSASDEALYRTGQISKGEYVTRTKASLDAYQALSAKAQGINNDYVGYGKTAQDLVDPLTTLATVGAQFVPGVGEAVDASLIGKGVQALKGALGGAKAIEAAPVATQAVDGVTAATKGAQAAMDLKGVDSLSNVPRFTPSLAADTASNIPVKIMAQPAAQTISDMKNLVTSAGPSGIMDGLSAHVTPATLTNMARSLTAKYLPDAASGIDTIKAGGQAAQAVSQAPVDSLSQLIDHTVQVMVNSQKIPVNVVTPASLDAVKLAIIKQLSPSLGSILSKDLPAAVLKQASDLLGAGKQMGGNVITGTIGKLIRNALVTQPTIQAAGSIPQDIAHGDYGVAAGNAAILAAPGALHAAAPTIKAGVTNAGDALFGREGGVLSRVFNPKDVAALTGAEKETALRGEQFTLNQQTSDPAQFLRTHLNSIGIDPSKPGALGDYINSLKQYIPKTEQLDQMIKDGEVPANAVVTKNPKAFVEPVTNALEQAYKDPAFDYAQGMNRLPMVNKIIENAGITNQTLASDFRKVMMETADAKSAAEGLKEVASKNIIKDMGDGFAATYGPKEIAAMPSAEDVAGRDFVLGHEPGPTAGKVGAAITKAGLSPLAVSPDTIRATLEDKLQTRLNDAGLNMDAGKTLGKLQSAASNVIGASDTRMLSGKQIDLALGTNNGTGKIVAKALRGAYRDLPASQVGAGGKLVNATMNPVMSKYLQVQQALRYQYNPFFNWLRVPIKAGIVATAEGAKAADMFIGGSSEAKSVAASHGLFGGNIGGVAENAADELGNTMPSGKQVNLPVRNMISGLLQSVADAHGISPTEVMNDPALSKQIEDSASLIKGYGTKGYLNSPLAKTLNTLIFPSRFDTKVGMEVGKIMARMPLAQQVGVIKTVANIAGFLNSNQGKQWAKDNSELLNAITYLTPAETIQGALNFFGANGANNAGHIQDLGQIGGLPFGVITTILTHQGLLHGLLGGSQYYDPKTGQPVPSKIPVTPTAQMQQGLTDLIGSMFSYPGATLGLPSKASAIQLIPGLKMAKGTYDLQLADGSAPPPKVNGTNEQQPTTTTFGTMPAPMHGTNLPPRVPAIKAKAVRSKTVAPGSLLPPL